jgi:secreted trypsin-like serine protease
MAEDNQAIKMFEELQHRINLLESEVQVLRGRAGAGGQRSVISRKQEVVSQDPFRRPEIFPPTTQDEPDAIVGGKPTSDFPDCCAVGDDTDFYCTGTLIARRLVVTARHCDDIQRVFLRGTNVDQLNNGEVISVTDSIAHDKYDLRILVLERDSEVTPCHVAQGAEIGNPKTARLVGFGNVNLAGTIGYGIKRMVDVPIASLQCATPNEETSFGCRGGKEMVAGHKGLLKDSCHGDSGGPLYIKNSNGGYYLLGATSRGLSNSNNACGDGGIYVRVDQFLDWIREVTGMEVEGPID